MDTLLADLRALRDDVRQSVCDDSARLARASQHAPTMRCARTTTASSRPRLPPRPLLGRSRRTCLRRSSRCSRSSSGWPRTRRRRRGLLDESSALLGRRVQALFGEGAANRETRIMVTLPSHAASMTTWSTRSSRPGWTALGSTRHTTTRSPGREWQRVSARRRKQPGRHVPILFDLPGPKLRTGAIEPGPRSFTCVRVTTRWERSSRRLAPGSPRRGRKASRPTPGLFCSSLPAGSPSFSPGEHVHFTDARGRQRGFLVGAGSVHGRSVETQHGAYLVSGAVLTSKSAGETRLGRLPARASFIPLAVGDTLLLTRAQTPGRAATSTSPARISCTCPEAFDVVSVGDSVWLDDGKFGGITRRVTPDAIEVEITQAPPGGGRLRAEKGINLPTPASRSARRTTATNGSRSRSPTPT